MNRIKWDVEEAVFLLNEYLNNNQDPVLPESRLNYVSSSLRARGEKMGLFVDEKYRNTSGISLQLQNIHYIATDGREGMSNVSKLFYEVYKLYENMPELFSIILKEYNSKY